MMMMMMMMMIMIMMGVELSVEWLAGETEPAPVPLCQRQIPHDPNWDGTRAVAVRSHRLTACVMPRPSLY
jgi:hypothetical protein